MTTNNSREVDDKYTSHEALKEWEAEKDQNKLTQNIVALLGIHGMHCKLYEYQNASHITKAFESLFHQQLQKARHDWLQEEIVKLEGMKLEIPTYLNKRGHHTNSAHRKIRYNKAIQTIIDRYQAELNSK